MLWLDGSRRQGSPTRPLGADAACGLRMPTEKPGTQADRDYKSLCASGSGPHRRSRTGRKKMDLQAAQEHRRATSRARSGIIPAYAFSTHDPDRSHRQPPARAIYSASLSGFATHRAAFFQTRPANASTLSRDAGSQIGQRDWWRVKRTPAPRKKDQHRPRHPASSAATQLP